MSVKVSVIIPTYNRPHFLKEAIKSVLYQTFKDFELIIVDDNSSIKIKEKAIDIFSDDRIIYIKNNTNLGGSGARNKGIEIAKGKYIAFLDDDDIWAKSKLEKQLEVFSQNESIDIVYCNRFIINENKQIISLREHHKNNDLSQEQFYLELLKKNNIVGGSSSFLASKKTLIQVNGFDESIRSAQDLDLFLRLAKNGNKFYCVNFPLYLFRHHHQERITTNLEAQLEGAKKYFKAVKEISPSLSANVKKDILFNELYCFGEIYYKHNNKKSRKYFKKAISVKKDKNAIKLYCKTYFGIIINSWIAARYRDIRDRRQHKKLVGKSEQYIKKEFEIDHN